MITFKFQECQYWKCNSAYRSAVLVYSILGSISRPFTSTFLPKSKVERTEAAASVTIEWARCRPAHILPERWWPRMLEEEKWTNNGKFTSYRTQMQCPSDLQLSCRFFHSSKSALAWIRAVLDRPVRHSTSPYGVEFEKREKSKLKHGRCYHHWLGIITELAGIW